MYTAYLKVIKHVNCIKNNNVGRSVPYYYLFSLSWSILTIFLGLYLDDEEEEDDDDDEREQESTSDDKTRKVYCM